MRVRLKDLVKSDMVYPTMVEIATDFRDCQDIRSDLKKEGKL